MKFLFSFFALILCSCPQPRLATPTVNPKTVEDEITDNKLGDGIFERKMALSKNLDVSWTVDFKKEEIIFILTSQTRGYIGFGLSPQGGMSQADVIIGGVHDDGTPYFTDRFSTAKSEPKIDDHPDWFLLEAKETADGTFLKFNRTFSTCDPEDLSITNDTTKFIWALGESDDVSYHAQRGVSSVNILDESTTNVDTKKFDVWHITVNTTIPTQDTAYWCTVHSSPKYESKRHIVGFKVKLDNEEALTHNHHLVLHKCILDDKDATTKETLRDFLTKKGGECYNDDGSGMQAVVRHCNTFLYVWAKGGADLFLPENVGLPLNEDGVEEYFLLEIHYDNPKVLDQVSYETGVEIYTTANLREQDAGLMTIGSSYSFTLMIPPQSENLVVSGQCSSQCTSKEMAAEGINVFNVLLHSHLSGRKLKLRHFRPDSQNEGNFTELPWVSNDDNYDFDYQQNRPLREHLKILPGDHLTYECTYNSKWRNPPSVTLGGLKTQNEMCEAFVLYYPRITTLDFCGSHFPTKKYFELFGIQAIDPKSDHRDPTVTMPEAMAGKKISTVLNTMIDWTDEKRREWAELIRYGTHNQICVGHKSKFGTGPQVNTTYPIYPKVYEPPQLQCSPAN